MSRFMTVSAAARERGVCARTIRRWADAGLLVVQRTAGGHRRIDRDSLATLSEVDEGKLLDLERRMGKCRACDSTSGRRRAYGT